MTMRQEAFWSSAVMAREPQGVAVSKSQKSGDGMKALTLWQPWASLIALGHKRVETRCWPTRYRGPLAIHAALNRPKFLGASFYAPEFQEALLMLHLIDAPGKHFDLPRGAVVATCSLVACVPTGEVYDELGNLELLFGNYEEGRYAWFLEDVQPLDPPIPAKGNRLLWNWKSIDSVPSVPH